ncbi:Ni/Fe-hydrogenase, b-type cytochrome subunit [Frateuria defendens]|uniref:Ni/Fe-hydrogenase, b-type cytochrome subunit n=1 Tax=Frateuria defendens TaxID=2219559 RepID=UPI00069F9714|nr:Ni/Fe-hydrogenase, b-type cytochrome subunit [Frateuria defendens]
MAIEITASKPAAAPQATAATAARPRSVYVYEAPVRIWHWVNMLAILVLCVTGYFIGKPLPTQPGEASANYLMGTLRFVHFTAAYVFAIGLLGRIYWALVGNAFSRELFYLPVFTRSFWQEVVAMLKWYALISREGHTGAGHNPLARIAMFGMFLFGSLFMVFTGFALYGEGEQAGSWADRLFGWVVPLFGQPQDVHTWHRLGMWYLVAFIVFHIYASIREDIMGRETVISTMVNGYRSPKE